MQEWTAFANELADLSAGVIMPYFKGSFAVDLKADRTPVTEADREAEQVMRQLIESRFPDHGILGEEWGHTRPEAEWTWVLDPIDGTHSFVSGVPLFGTLIALLRHGEPVLGIINCPALDERTVGIRDQPTTWNSQPVQVSSTRELKDSTLVVTDHRHIREHQDARAFQKLLDQVYLYRHWGDCYMYTLLARGKIDIAVDAIMNPWDIQALIPVVRGAGGQITDYQGSPPEKGASIIAANPSLHPQVISLVNS